MLVFGGQDFLLRVQAQAAVDHPEAFGGAAGEGDLAWLDFKIAACPFTHLGFVLPLALGVPLDAACRVLVKLCAKAFDRFAHGARVRGDEEVGEVRVVGVELEQLAKTAPGIRGRRRARRRLGAAQQLAGQGQPGCK
ncbi:hypothetical protein D3C76_577990 [compost metagenome]